MPFDCSPYIDTQQTMFFTREDYFELVDQLSLAIFRKRPLTRVIPSQQSSAHNGLP